MHRAIETRYAGYRFRSRLEARYAVFFDSLKIKWDYEPEGFELPSGRYLPDFWLPLPERPEWGYWVEIKALAPTFDERQRMAELCHATKHNGWFFWGPPSTGSLTISQVAGKSVDLTSGQKTMLLEWAAPIRTREMTKAEFERACNAATGARFEFRDGRHGATHRTRPSADAFDEVAE